MNHELSLLHDMCHPYTVLYAEDDEQTQEGMAAILKRLFKTVYLAPNGEVGLALFQEHKPHLVITDIQMPKLNGLEMSKAIKELSPQTPIIITTAFNEERYFLSAIENGVDSFLFKPIDKQKLFQTLIKTISQIAYEAKAKELETLKKIEEINHASIETIQNLSNLFPFPTLFYQDNRLIFINTEALKTFAEIGLEAISQETLFVSRFNLSKDAKQKIKLPTSGGLNRIYWVYPNALFVGADLSLVQAYIFIDITLMEYQKIRLNAYSLPYVQKHSESSKSPTAGLSAHNFIATLQKSHQEEIATLRELQDFIVNFAHDYHTHPTDAIRAKIIEIYACYAKIMQTLSAFQPVGETLQKTVDFLVTLTLDTRKAQQLSLFLISLSEYLFEWYHSIFVAKTAANIHHCDDAIIASCFQMQSELTTNTNTILGDDLELS